MASKVPQPAGGDPLAGDWRAQQPITDPAGGGAHISVQAGPLGPPSLVLPFVPTDSAYDVDNLDTYVDTSLIGRVRTFAWSPVTGKCTPLYAPATGTFTFQADSNAAGYLYIWF